MTWINGKVNTVLPLLVNPPPVEQLKQGTIHTHVSVRQFLMDRMRSQAKLIPNNIIALLEQLLQVNPDDRPSIVTLVTNQTCAHPLLPKVPSCQTWHRRQRRSMNNYVTSTQDWIKPGCMRVAYPMNKS